MNCYINLTLILSGNLAILSLASVILLVNSGKETGSFFSSLLVIIIIKKVQIIRLAPNF